MMLLVQGGALTMGPPADIEYAVLPEGVAMMRPSACAQSIESLIQQQELEGGRDLSRSRSHLTISEHGMHVLNGLPGADMLR